MKGRLKLHRFVKKSNNYYRYGYGNVSIACSLEQKILSNRTIFY